MKSFMLPALLAAALGGGCSTTPRPSQYAGTTHITVSGTAGVAFTGFYVQDDQRTAISNVAPWSLEVPRMSTLELRKSSYDGDLLLNLSYEAEGIHSHAEQRLGPGLTGARVRVRDGLIVTAVAAHKGNENRTEQVLYYDRNGDGRVDLERHHFPGVADADWELRDDKYDGWYEKKILYGYAVEQTAVHLLVPTNVHIEPKP
jgi:hypothetical protein